MTLHSQQKPASEHHRLLSLDGCEQLEHRQMLAGNVTAVITSSGVLRIMGDAEDNQVEVTTIVNPSLDGRISVEGKNGTRVNGELNADFNLTPLQINGLAVSLRGGNDRLEFEGEGLKINGRLNVNSGAGDDLIAFKNGDVTTNAASRIVTGAGDDMVLFAVDDHSGAGVQIRTGGGNDQVSVGAETLHKAKTTIDGRTDLRLGGGDDWVLIRNQHSEQVLVQTGGGRDLVAYGADSDKLDVRMGGGIDQFYVNDVGVADIGLVTGGGSSDDIFKIDPVASVGFEVTTRQFEVEETTDDATTLFNIASNRFRGPFLARDGSEDLLD